MQDRYCYLTAKADKKDKRYEYYQIPHLQVFSLVWWEILSQT